VEEVVVKEVPLPWRRRAFHRLGGRSRFRHDFERGRRLETLGVLSPRVLACSLRPCGGSECEISEFVRGGETLREVLWLGGGSLAGAERRRRLLEDVGRWLRRLHELGVWQRDLKPHNVVVRFPAGRAEAGCAEAGRTEIFLLDTTAVRFLGRPLAIGRRTRNLAQVLDVPASLDEEVPPPVLDAYLEGEPALRSEWKSRVARAVERRRRRRQRVDGFRYIDMHLGEQALGARGEVTG
jgi:tRNA A-37 threonylcarbamoyl transferase component Bud32